MKRAVLATSLMLLFQTAATQRIDAQERLTRDRTFGVGLSIESINFGGAGLLQGNFAGLDSARVQRALQLTMPVTASVALSSTWRADITALYGSGSVTFTDPTIAAGHRTTRIDGVSDVRMRATGRFLRESMFLTLGLNAPTGRTTLDAGQFSTLRILAAPALGMSTTPVGAGPSGTVGLVYAHRIGEWAMAIGASYEHRGRYQPVAALTAGAPSADFTPGGVVRTSLSAERLLGSHKMTVAVAADRFADDRLESLQTGAATDLADATIRLGPVVATDVQLQLAVPHLRELLVYGSHRVRTAYRRDGVRVAESGGQYLEMGTRGVWPVARRLDLYAAADGRLHSGLGVDQGAPTAGVTSGGLSTGLSMRYARGVLQPYARVQAGTLRQRNAVQSSTSQAFTGASVGLVAMVRF